MVVDTTTYDSYSRVKERLDEIAIQVADETIPLDDALNLYDEAVSLALLASELIETDEEEENDADVDVPQNDSLTEGQGAVPSQE